MTQENKPMTITAIQQSKSQEVTFIEIFNLLIDNFESNQSMNLQNAVGELMQAYTITRKVDHLMPLTPTAIELMNSPEFWSKRSEEQIAYCIHYNTSYHTRPDHHEVLSSAIQIMRRCDQRCIELLSENRSAELLKFFNNQPSHQ